MPIIITLDLEMAKKKMSLTKLSEIVGISMTNLSLLKTGKVRGIRFSTLNSICKTLDCQPGDILKYEPVKGITVSNGNEEENDDEESHQRSDDNEP